MGALMSGFLMGADQNSIADSNFRIGADNGMLRSNGMDYGEQNPYFMNLSIQSRIFEMSNILKQVNDNPEPGNENQNNLMTSKGGFQMPRNMMDSAYNNVGSSSISRTVPPNPNFNV